MSDLDVVIAFNTALAAFQAECPHVVKGRTANAGNYSYDYADLTDITEAVLPVLSKHGLAFNSKPTLVDGVFVLHYALRHEGGHVDTGTYPLPDASRFNAQQVGSALTYARRYALCAATGVAPGGDDDDAATAGDARAADPMRAPQRAQRTNARDIDPQTVEDAFASPVVTDAAWLDGFHTRLTACTKPSEIRGLDEEAHVMFAERRLTSDDAKALKAAIDDRMKEVAPA